jgi:hypothetical protein
VIVDWTGFSLRHTGALSPKALRLILEGLQVGIWPFELQFVYSLGVFQDAFPARFKSIHMVGQPWYLEAALSMIRPFLKEKTRNKVSLVSPGSHKNYCFDVNVQIRN